MTDIEEVDNRILQKWMERHGNRCILDGLESDRKKPVAVAMEQQCLLNNMLPNGRYDQFKRISIPIVRRLMEAIPELHSTRRYSANTFITSISTKESLTERFRRSMMPQLGMDYEADLTFGIVEGLKNEIQKLMKQFDKTSMIFLGLTLDDNDFVCIYYDWN